MKKENSRRAKILSLFKVTAKDILFIVGSLALPILIYILSWSGIIEVSDTRQFINILGYVLQIYLLVLLFLYKKFTKCDEFNLFRYAFQLSAIITIGSIILLLTLIGNTRNPAYYFAGQILGLISSLLTSFLGFLGIIYFFYVKKLDIREIITLFFLSIIVSLIAAVHTYYLFGLDYSKFINVSLLVQSIIGVLFSYAYFTSKKIFNMQVNILPFFVTFGLIIFIIEYLNGLLVSYFGYVIVNEIDQLGLLLLNLEYLIYFVVWGIILHFYSQKKNKMYWIIPSTTFLFLLAIYFFIPLISSSSVIMGPYTNTLTLIPAKELTHEELEFSKHQIDTMLKGYSVESNIVGDNLEIKVRKNVIQDLDYVKKLVKAYSFEAKIDDKVVFTNGKDITYVCTTSDCAGIDPYYGCRYLVNESTCRFRFTIILSNEAAKRQAEITSSLDIVYDEYYSSYLSSDLNLYLNGEILDTLRIGSELKGAELTEIQISGSGTGTTEREAKENTLSNMKKLQSVLSIATLPTDFKVVLT